jgi:hypothetical protein
MTATSGENVAHIVNGIQHLKAFAAMSPRSLCGLKLTPRAKAEYPTADAPTCPECAALNR